MGRYLTPAHIRAGGTGLPLAGVQDSVLADLIDQAEAEVDAHMGFAEDDGLGFGPGQRTNEKTPWSTRSFRAYPRCAPVPITSMTSFKVVVSQQASDGSAVAATVPPNLIIVNNDLGYVEVISTTITVYGLVPVLLDLAASEPFVSMTYQAGYSIPKTNFPIYDAGDGVTFHSFRPQWDLTQPVSVAVGGVTQSIASYTVDAANGVITFSATQPIGASVTASFTHQIPDIVTKATRKCFLEQAGEWARNSRNMAGLDLVKSGHQEARRMKPGLRPSENMTWRQMLDGLKPWQMAPATNSFRW